MIDSAESLCSVLMKNFGLLALRNTCCGNACFGAQVSSKYELDIVNGSFCNLCALALWLALHIFATQC